MIHWRQGESSFGDFAESIIKDLLKIAAQAAILKIFEGAGAANDTTGGGILSQLLQGAFSGLGGNAAASGAGNGPSGPALQTQAAPPVGLQRSLGGRYQSPGDSAFQRFSTTPLINVDNTGAQELVPTEVNTRFDSQQGQQVIDVVLGAAGTAGKNRDALRRALG